MAVIKSKKLRDSARGEDCSINIQGVCNYQPETSIMAHVPSPISGYKSSDLGGAIICCSSCHDVIDRRVINDEFELERDWYILRAVQVTLNKLYEMGVISVKGAA